MDPTHVLITINILVAVAGVLILSRDLREISNIRRAIFLMIRRQYGDIERDLQEVRDLVKAR